MMLKIILYAYTQRIYSSREIAKQLQENVFFMRLAGHQKPDFRTINRFRSERMKEIIYEVFYSIVDLLHEQGLVKLEHYFLVGTKIEANANKYTFVWGGEENYEYCEEQVMEAYIKYSTLDKEQTNAWKKQIGRLENMTYAANGSVMSNLSSVRSNIIATLTDLL